MCAAAEVAVFVVKSVECQFTEVAEQDAVIFGRRHETVQDIVDRFQITGRVFCVGRLEEVC